MMICCYLKSIALKGMSNVHYKIVRPSWSGGDRFAKIKMSEVAGLTRPNNTGKNLAQPTNNFFLMLI